MVEEVKQLLTKPWQKFFDKLNEFEDLKVSQWKDVHVLGYILKRYKDLHDKEYSITVKNAPSKCPDMVIVRRIFATLNTTNMKTIKDYIDWVYDTKVAPKKMKFRTIGFFLTTGFANEFLNWRDSAKNSFSRASELPSDYLSIASSLGVHASTYGDLAFIQMAVEANDDKSSNNFVLLKNLEVLGLDLDKLKELK